MGPDFCALYRFNPLLTDTLVGPAVDREMLSRHGVSGRKSRCN